MHFSTYIFETKYRYTYELAKYMYKISNQVLPNEITEEHENTSNHHNFYTGQFDNKILIIPLCKS